MGKSKNRGNPVSGVTPQGYSGGGKGDTSPKSRLENIAKHSNTKR